MAWNREKPQKNYLYMASKHIKKIHPTRNEGKMSIVIPAAGLGRRMKSRGPKPLIKIKQNTSILQNQILNIEDAFNHPQIVLVSGFEADKVMNESPDNLIKIENESYEDTNVARSIGVALRAISSAERVLIIYGDLVFNEKALEVLDYSSSSLFIVGNFIGEEEVGCVVNQKGNLENMMYDLPDKWSQIAYFQDAELDYLKQIVWNKNNSRLFGFEVINKIIEKGGKFKCEYAKDIKIVDVDTSKDIQKARQII